MECLETSCCLCVILKNHMRLDRLAQLQLISFFHYLDVLVESGDMTISLTDLLLVFLHFLLQLLDLSSLMIN